MTKSDRQIFFEWIRMCISAAVAFILLLLMLAMCGCRTQYVPMPEYHMETLRSDTAIFNAILRTFRESVRSNQRSSDSLTHLLKETTTLTENGDTARHDRIEYIYLSSYKEQEYEKTIKEQSDSIGILNARLESVKADSIPVPYPVEKKLTKWEKTKMDLGGIAFGIVIAVVIGAVIVWLAKKYRK